MTMCGSDKYDPIDLDAFNADASAVGRQPVSSSFSSSLQATSTVLPPAAAVAPGGFTPHAVSGNYLPKQEIAGYHPIFGYYPVTSLPPQVPHTNSSPAVPTLPPIPQPTPDRGIETPPAGLPFCPTLPPIQINSPTPIPVPSRAQTPADGQPTNLPPAAMPGIRGRGGKGSRGGRGSRGERVGRGGRNTRGGRGGRGEREVQEETAPAIPTANNLPGDNNNDLNPAAGDLNGEDPEAERPRRRPRNRNMTPQEKLVLIRECCKHADEYRTLNKTKFWAMIQELLKNQTGYDLVDPRQTIGRWVEARLDELVEEEMESGTEVEKDDFKSAVEQFTNRWQTVANEIEDMVITRQERAAKNLEAARLENNLIFQVDDEPIPGLDTPTNSTRSGTPSIALNGRGKCKRSEMESTNLNNDAQPSKDAVLLATSFRESTAALAAALRDNRNPVVPAALPAPTSVPDNYEHRIDKVKTELKNEMGEMWSMMERILQAVAGQRAAAENSAAANQR